MGDSSNLTGCWEDGRTVSEGPKPDRVTVQGDKLRQMREERGVYRSIMAREMGISIIYLKLLEDGHFRTIEIELAEKLAAYLDAFPILPADTDTMR